MKAKRKQKIEPPVSQTKTVGEVSDKEEPATAAGASHLNRTRDAMERYQAYITAYQVWVRGT